MGDPSLACLQIARQSWEDVYAVIVHHLNRFAGENGLSLIDAQKLVETENTSTSIINDHRECLIGALKDIRTHNPDLLRGFNPEGVIFWIFGSGNKPMGLTDVCNLEFLVEQFLPSEQWSESTWESYIIKPVERHANEIRSWFADLANKLADSKADSPNKPKGPIPENLRVLRLAKKINNELSPGATKHGIALEFTNGDEKEANNLLRQLRPSRYGHLLTD